MTHRDRMIPGRLVAFIMTSVHAMKMDTNVNVIDVKKIIKDPVEEKLSEWHKIYYFDL